jgi:L-alanine-DL-glutamate epimerase-like enolase superfamily enzyme
LKHPLAVARGKLSVPDAPGLGVEIDETKIPRFAVKAP